MRVLLLNQAFYPDVVATAHYAGDLAAALAESGHHVDVVASSRGYDDPRMRFAPRETWRGVHIHRVGVPGFGKRARWRRALDFAGFMVACAVRMLTRPRADVVVAMTSPPLISFLAALLARLRGSRLVIWSMDLNPDEAIAAGWLRPGSLLTRALTAMQLYSLRSADRIIVLDRFMRQRIAAKGLADTRLTVIPPWPHDGRIRYEAAGREEFRSAHALDGKFVVMYSGNHSPCHPVATLLAAARQLASQRDIVFLFVGGGSEFRNLERLAAAERLANVICLPYVAEEKLAGSLSAADLHVVLMGDAFTGIVHPCKIYNVLRVGAPVLYIGPPESHVADLVARVPMRAYPARHGEVDAVVAAILQARAAPPPSREPQDLPFSRDVLLSQTMAAVTDEQHARAAGA
jgi:colanic acid biosynthesis glycosyl transferase WcaI